MSDPPTPPPSDPPREPAKESRSTATGLLGRIRESLNRVVLRGAAQSPAPRRLDDESTGKYQIVHEIARGGVGVVLRTHDSDLGRDVAMKVIRSDRVDHPAILQRFVEEAQIGGQLQHPGIVPVYELGVDEDRGVFFTMKLIKGDTLSALLEQREDPSKQRRKFLSIFEQICHTMAYAHSRGVIHRDLKSSNVMVGAFGEVQVVDWGFAKVLSNTEEKRDSATPPDQSQVSVIETVRSKDSSHSESVAGSIMGTPAYMPPEQAQGRVDKVCESSDVFALGAILCEILTGRPAYTGEQDDVIMEAVEARIGPAYDALDQSGADADLIAFCKRCLSPPQQARPHDAQIVADEVGKYLTSVEERARVAQIAAAEERVRANGERKARRLILLMASLVLLATAGGVGGYLWSEGQARVRRESNAALVRVELEGGQRLWTRAELAPVGELDLWDDALTAIERAHTLVAREEMPEEARRRVETVHREFKQAYGSASMKALQREDELELLRRLDQIAAMEGSVTGEFNISSIRHVEYTETLREYDLDLEALEVEEAADRIRATTIQNELVEFLDRIAFTATAREGSRHLLQIADAIDADSTRRAARKAMLEENADSLRALATLALGEEWPPETLRLLAAGLLEADATAQAEKVLTLGVQRYPREFSLQFLLGRVLLASNRPQAALGHFMIAASVRPESVMARDNIAVAFWNSGDRDEATKLWRDLADEHPDVTSTHVRVGWSQMVSGELHAAEETLRSAIDAEPEYVFARMMLSDVLAQLGQIDAALAQAREAVRLAPTSSGAVLTLGRRLWLRDDQPGAVQAYRDALQLEPENVDARNDLGFALWTSGDGPGAEEAFAAAVEAQPDNPWSTNWLGYTKYKNGDPEGAIPILERAVELDPDHENAWVNLRNVWTALGEHHKALEAARQRARIEQTASSYYSLGVRFRRLGRLDEAIAAYRKAIEIDPRYKNVHNILGYTLQLQNRLFEAIEAFRQEIEYHPGYLLPVQNLSDTYLMLGDREGALAVLREAIEGGNSTTMNDLGISLRNCGDYDGALQVFHRMTQVRSQQVEAYRQVGETLRWRGDLEDALDAFEEALRQQPDHAGSLQSMGLTQLALGDVEGAIRSLRRAVELDPEDRFYSSYLALAVRRVDREEADRLVRLELSGLEQKLAQNRQDNQTRNSLAWLLAGDHESAVHDPVRAIELVEQVTLRLPGLSSSWNTLATARYRVGDWQGCIEAAQESIDRRPYPGEHDALLMAMAWHQLGDEGQAFDWWEQAEEWRDYKPYDEENRCLRIETEELIF